MLLLPSHEIQSVSYESYPEGFRILVKNPGQNESRLSFIRKLCTK